MRTALAALAMTLALLAVLMPLSDAGAALGMFIENRGQVDSAVEYYAVCPEFAVYLTASAIVLDVRQPVRGPRSLLSLDDDQTPPLCRLSGCAVYLRFEGSSESANVEGRGKGATELNYFLGDDPSRWFTRVPSYSEILYRDAWPGIDLVLRLGEGELEYSIIARDGADPKRVCFAYEGQSGFIARPDGSALVETSAGDIEMTPWSCGTLRGSWGAAGRDARQAETGLLSNSLDEPSSLVASTYLGGGTTWEEGYSVALDQDENVVVAGYSYSPDFPVTPGSYDVAFGGNCDGFVAKVSASCDDLMWCTFLGSMWSDYCLSVAVDATGDIVVSGTTTSTDFPTTAGAFDTTWNSNWDGFVTKIAPGGDSLLWSTYFGGSASDWIYGLVLDPSGNIVISGRTFSANFPISPGAYDSAFSGKRDVFVSRLSSSGDSLLSSTYLGGSGSEWGYNVSLDSQGNAIVAGVTDSAVFPTTAGAFDRTFNGGLSDAFVAKISEGGDALLWSTFLGGAGQEEGQMVAEDPWGGVVVTGFTTSSDFPATAGAFDTSYSGVQDGFVAKIASDGDSLIWGSFLGGGAFERGYGLVIAESGNPVVTGSSSSTDFPTTPDAYSTALSGGSLDDVFITVMASSGDRLLWSSYLGGTDMDRGYGVVLDAQGNPVVTGPTYSADFPLSPGAYDSTFNGGECDVFVSRLDISAASGIGPGGIGPAVVSAGETFPNPSGSSVSLRFNLVEPGDVSVGIFDAQGRLLRHVYRGEAEAGSNVAVWDGKRENGDCAAPGVYFWVVEAQGSRFVKKTVLLR